MKALCIPSCSTIANSNKLPLKISVSESEFQLVLEVVPPVFIIISVYLEWKAI